MSESAFIDDTPAAADLAQLSLEELMQVQVSTISRVDERIDTAPGSVYQYSREVIQERGYRNLGELLQVVPGFTVFHRDLAYVAGVRGLNANDNEKITLLINGQNVNGVNEPNFLNGPINLDNAERVEVVVGPSSLFQQANTLAATVNVITKDIEGGDVIVGVGNDLRYSATAMLGHRWEPDEYLSFSFTTEDIRGFDAYESDFRPNISGQNMVGELDQPNFFSILKGQYGEVSGQLIAYRTTSPELLIDDADRRNDGYYTDQFYSGYVKIEHPIADGLLGIATFDVNYKDQQRRNEGGLPFNTLQQTCSQLSVMTDMSLQYTGLKKHLIQAGVQGTYDHNFDTWYTLNSPGLVIPRTTLVDEDTYAVGFYADDEFQIAEKWKLIGGVRVDRNTRLEPDRWYPGWRTAVVYEPFKAWTTKLVYNRAVRMPSALAALNEAWGNDKPTAPDWAQLSPRATQPETLTTLEWQNIFYVGGMRLAATVYHQELKNFISWFGPHTNVGNFSGNGVELSLQAPVTENLTIWANGSHNASKLKPFEQYAPDPGSGMETHHVLTNEDGRIIGTPEFTANVGFDYHINRKITFSPTLRYFTEQAGFDFSDNDFVVIHNRFYLDASLLWKDVFKNVDLRLTATNVLNNRDEVAGQWLRDTYRPRGFSFIASLEWRF